MANLVVLGNGFDIAHGLNTRYSCFMSYLSQYEKEPRYYECEGLDCSNYKFAYRDSISERDELKHKFCEELCKYIPEYDLWNEFEAALGILDYEEIKENNSEYLIGYGDDNWKDSANHDYQLMVGEDLKFSKQISYYFSEWIKIFNTHTYKMVSSKIICNDNIFINFNYTDTLEKTYGIEDSKILYIHGKALRNDKLIVGHCDNSYFCRGRNFNEDMDFRECEAEEEIRNYFKSTYKDTKKIITKNLPFFESLSSIEEIYILGHSLSEIDIEYFVKIKKIVVPDCKWIISYYSKDDLDRISVFVNYLGIINYRTIIFEDII